MSLFNFFKKPTSPAPAAVAAPVMPEPIAPTVAQAALQTVPEVAPQAPANEAKSSGDVVSIAYGTGMPIDVIYAFIGHDYEQDGYRDALVNANAEYCKAKEAMILNKLRMLFRQVLLRYQGEIRGLNVQIENLRSLFDITNASMLEARKETCEEHMAEINEMIAKLDANSPEMMTMIDSYRRGFSRGCASRTADFLAPNFVNPRQSASTIADPNAKTA